MLTRIKGNLSGGAWLQLQAEGEEEPAENSRGSTTGTLGPSSERAPSASCGRARRRRPPGSHAAAVIMQVNQRSFLPLIFFFANKQQNLQLVLSS